METTAASPQPSAPSPQAEEHPEYLVGAAFVGGFLLAQIMKRFRR